MENKKQIYSVLRRPTRRRQDPKLMRATANAHGPPLLDENTIRRGNGRGGGCGAPGFSGPSGSYSGGGKGGGQAERVSISMNPKGDGTPCLLPGEERVKVRGKGLKIIKLAPSLRMGGKQFRRGGEGVKRHSSAPPNQGSITNDYGSLKKMVEETGGTLFL